MHTIEFQISLLSPFSNLSSFEFMNYQTLRNHQILQVQILGHIPAALHFCNLQLLVSGPLEFSLCRENLSSSRKLLLAVNT